MASIYYNLDNLENWATKISGSNTTLMSDLHEIQSFINSLAGDWESDSATTIREKISGMEPRFQQYYDVVDNYVKFIRNMVQENKAVEAGLKSNADQFV